MRMTHYFGAAAALVVPALLLTAITGIWGGAGERHIGIGLFSSVYTVGVHTLLILFMILTGRIIKAAMKARPLSPEFLEELNAFFAHKRAYPMALLGAVFAVGTAILGYAPRGLGLSSAVHMLVGIGAIVFNAVALPVEWRALRRNQDLLDRTARELDRLEREEPLPPVEPEDESWASPAVRWLLFAASWWTPYLYWGVVEYRGDFGPVSIHPWLELSALGLVAAWLSRRRDGDDYSESSSPKSS